MYDKALNIFNEYIRYFDSLSDKPVSGRPIFIAGAQRSGTTWVANMLNIPGVRLYNEPFGTVTSKLWNNNFENNNELVEALNERYQRIISGKNYRHFNWPGESFDERKTNGRFSPISVFGMSRGRVIIKDPPAIENLELINSLGEMDFLIMRRHPCGYVSSLKKLTWKAEARVKKMIEDPKFSRYEFGNNTFILKNNIDSLSYIDQLTLQYCMFQAILQSFITDNSNTKLYRYEDLCINSIDKFKAVFSDFNLPYTDRTRQKHMHLTSGASEKTKDDLSIDRPGGKYLIRHYVKRNAEEYAYIWKKRLSQDEVDRVRRIYESFDLPDYHDQQDWALKF